MRYKTYLKHYGVKGMKWGVRHDRPRSGKTRKSGKFQNRTKIGRSAADSVLSMYGGSLLKDLQRRRLEKHFPKGVNTGKKQDLKIINNSGLSQGAKEVLVHGNWEDMTPKQAAEIWKATKEGSLDNCTDCTSAAAMRYKNYDVVAGKRTFPVSSNAFLSCWEHSKIEEVPAGTKEPGKYLNSKLKAQGNGAYGALLCFVPGVTGHCVEYRVEKENVRVYDNQIGLSFNSLDDFYSETGRYKPENTWWVRLDNKNPNLKQMKRRKVVKPRK